MNVLTNLTINNRDSLQCITSVDGNDINLYNTVFTIWLLRKNHEMLNIDGFAVGHDLWEFWEDIKEALEQKRKIPKELRESAELGLLWNHHIQKIVLAEEADKPLKSWSWIGDDLLFFANKGAGLNSSITFLYNNEQGEIVLEVCAVYPWFFGEDSSVDQYISYDDWLPEYKTLYREVISYDTAKNWIKHLQDLYNKMNANMPSGMDMPFDK